MVPFYILISAFFLSTVLARWALRRQMTFQDRAGVSLAIMFFFTGATHFTSMRFEYAAMIPPPLPNGMWIIYTTGALEWMGAAGLLIHPLRRAAALGLSLLLVTMTPANIYASIAGIEFRGQPPASLWIRVPIQILFIAVLMRIAAGARRKPTRSAEAASETASR